MGWSYRYKADDQLYADDEHGPTVFDPGAPISAGSGNVVSVGLPLLGQIAIWTDATHIAGQTVIPTSAHPALTGDVICSAGATVTAYNAPMPASKAGLPTGGAPGQILVKNSGANFDTGWATGGGNVSNVATPLTGQLAVWTDAFHIQGAALLPAANHPPISGDIVIASGTLVSAYNNAVPPAKAGLPVGGTTGQVLSKIDGTNFNASWINPPATGGNVSNSGAPQGGQVAIWVDDTHVKGLNTLPIASGGVPPGGATGEVLKKNTGTNFDYGWATDVSGGVGGSPGGASTQLQFNAAGAFGGSPNAYIDPADGMITVTGNGAVPYYAQLKVLPPTGGDAAIFLRSNHGTPNDWFFGAGSGAGWNHFRIVDLTSAIADVLTIRTGSGHEVVIAGKLAWTATDAGGTIDTAIARTAAGTVKVTDGGAGTGTITGKGTVPAGGAANQVLQKATGTDYDVAWGTPTGGTGDLTFVHNQVSPSTSWSVVHNLGKFPSVSVVDSGQTLILPDILYVNSNQLTVSFGSATSGKAYIN